MESHCEGVEAMKISFGKRLGSIAIALVLLFGLVSVNAGAATT